MAKIICYGEEARKALERTDSAPLPAICVIE